MDDMTLDELARITAEGFAATQEQFNILREEFTAFKLDISGEVQSIHRRLDDVTIPTLDEHARRIKDLEIAAS